MGSTLLPQFMPHTFTVAWDYMRRKHILMKKGESVHCGFQLHQSKLLTGVSERKVIVHYTGVGY